MHHTYGYYTFERQQLLLETFKLLYKSNINQINKQK